MKRRIKNRLNTMLKWLAENNVNYTKKDFMEEIERMSDAIDEALWCEILTDEEYTILRDLIVKSGIKGLQMVA